MENYIFVEKYEVSMEELKGKISDKNHNKLSLFFANTNIDHKQRGELIKIIEDIRTKNDSEHCSEERCGHKV